MPESKRAAANLLSCFLSSTCSLTGQVGMNGSHQTNQRRSTAHSPYKPSSIMERFGEEVDQTQHTPHTSPSSPRHSAGHPTQQQDCWLVAINQIRKTFFWYPPVSTEARMGPANAPAVRGLGIAVATALLLALACRCAAAQPSAGSGCMPELVRLSPCMDYLSGNATTPDGPSCCSALSGMLASSPGCLCMVVGGTAASLGVAVDGARAAQLPGACKVQAPPASQCNGKCALVLPDRERGDGKRVVGIDTS